MNNCCGALAVATGSRTVITANRKGWRRIDGSCAQLAALPTRAKRGGHNAEPRVNSRASCRVSAEPLTAKQDPVDQPWTWLPHCL